MHYNKIENSTATGPHCTTNGFKVPFFMPYLSSSKIISHHFHVDNNKGESVIGHDMIIDRKLMVQLGLFEDFRCQLLQ